MTTNSRPTLAEVLSLAVDGGLADVRVMLPGVITKYDKQTQRADVQLLVQDIVDGIAVTIPVISDVPVLFPRFGSSGITFPLPAGTGVMVGFASSSIAKIKGGAKGIHSPGDTRHHRLSDAVVICGFDGKPPTDAPDDAVVIHGDSIKLGSSSADDPIARKSDLQFLKDQIMASPDGSTFGTTLKASLSATWPLCLSIVKAD